MYLAAKRMAAWLLVVLAAGTVLTYASSWLCTIFVPVQNRPLGGAVNGRPSGPRVHQSARSFGVLCDLVVAPGVDPGDGTPTEIEWTRWEAGWPLFATHATLQTDAACVRDVWKHDGIRSVEDPGAPWILPHRVLGYRPIWRGFLLDTLFYAALTGGLLWVPHAINHVTRRRRGLCPACGYPLTGLAPGSSCPECGKPDALRPTPHGFPVQIVK